MLKFSAMVWRSRACLIFGHERWKRKRGLGNEDFHRNIFVLCGV